MCYKSIACIFLIIIVLAFSVTIKLFFIRSKGHQSNRCYGYRSNLKFGGHCANPCSNETCLVSDNSFGVFDSLSACTSKEVLLVSLEVVFNIGTAHVFSELSTLGIRPWGTKILSSRGNECLLG